MSEPEDRVSRARRDRGPKLQRSRLKTTWSDMPGLRGGNSGLLTVLPAASFAQCPRGGKSKSARRQAFAKPTSEIPKRLAIVRVGFDQTRSNSSCRENVCDMAGHWLTLRAESS
jgi:hypothetical protein